MATVEFPRPVDSHSDLLDALRPDDLALLIPGLVECHFDSGEVVYNPGDNVEYCYFPTGPAMCSYFVELEDGTAVETICK